LRYSEIKSALKEQPWNNQYDSGSLSSKIFQPGDFISNQGDPIWGLWLPLSSNILHKLTPKKQRVTAFHLTGVQNIDNMINLQGKKKSISSFFYMHHSHYDRGVRGGGGVIFELDANLLGAFEQDIMSDPDKSGMRWITLEYLVRAASEHGEPLVKLYSEMADLLKTLLKKYAPDVTYDSDIDAGNKWTEFGKSLATTKDGKTQNIVIKDYIDGTYSIMLKHAEHVRKALFYYMDNPGSTQDDWDEVVVNEFKIKTAHVLKNTAEDPQNLEKLKQLESKGIPVRVWDSPQELNDYVEKIGMSQKLQETAVTEAFDNPYPITWEYLKPTGPSSAIGKIDDGSALDIHISEDPAGIYEIEFARGQSNKNMGRSGQGDEFRIFATVQSAMLQWWEQLDKTSTKKITFYANKEDGNRARLYKRFLKMWGDKSEWDIEVNGNAKPGLVAYTLTNPDPDEPQNDKKTWLQRLFGEEQTIENFADGKKKGKSRPGRVKKSGASCNGSVTALRKRAKNASGEKAKMYHWCANMKSGKKKK